MDYSHAAESIWAYASGNWYHDGAAGVPYVRKDLHAAEIARLTAALAEAEARSAALVAGAYEAAVEAIEALPRRQEPIGGQMVSYVQIAEAITAIRALANKETGAVFPPPHCTAWEDCNHDGICHDPKCCGATGPNHEAFYGEAGE